jgi:hypothetical protein
MTLSDRKGKQIVRDYSKEFSARFSNNAYCVFSEGTPLVIGLSIGIPVLVILVSLLAGVAYAVKAKQQKLKRGQKERYNLYR